MNQAKRILMLSVATFALATLFAATAPGQQSRRGNPAEVERLERERRDREMREADLRERQFLLRTMEPDRRPATPPAPRLAVAQIREDFVRLQVLNNDLAKVVSRGGALDLKFVSKSAAEMRKLAGRLKENLFLPSPEDNAGDPEAKAATPPEQLGPALTALDALVLRFADGMASKGVFRLDAQSSARARGELEEIVELSGWVKKTSEKLERSNRSPR